MKDAARLFIKSSGRKYKCQICNNEELSFIDAITHVMKVHKDSVNTIIATVKNVVGLRDLNSLREVVTDAVCKELDIDKDEIRKAVDDFIAARIELAVGEDFESFCRYISQTVIA